jgi:hypothetical protein
MPCDQAAAAMDRERGSSTHASRANQRWLALQCGQYASAKKTGEQLNLRRSASIPVGTVRPVAGQEITTLPIQSLLFKVFFSRSDCREA